MSNIRITLDPSQLENPDLDIRYAIPDALAAIDGSTMVDRGYDYSDRNPPDLQLFLQSESAASDARLAIEYFRSNRVLDNDLSHAIIDIAVSEGLWERVFPEV